MNHAKSGGRNPSDPACDSPLETQNVGWVEAHSAETHRSE
jgi:hypothetical protein